MPRDATWHQQVKHRLRAIAERFSNNKRSRSRQPLPQVCNLPSIPPEVWGIIIQHACLLDHDPLDVSQELSFLESATMQLTGYRYIMRVKLALSLVSKEWNALCRPFLYEFVWISRSVQARLLAAMLRAEDKTYGSSGQYIRRLHIETLALERCTPADLRTILDHAPHLHVFSDHQSVQRQQIEHLLDPRCSPEELLRLVAHATIRRLSWTNYDHTPFPLHMHPLESNLAIRLEYLELSSYAPNAALQPALAKDAAQRDMNVSLPSLRALKVSLDNATFAALASWDMPRLTNLSVLSSDFCYTGAGFAQFFRAHGSKLTQLELGHSSSLIEEHYLTTPRHILHAQQTAAAGARRPIPLADWCPNLREFVCSADAEWHWQSPDWIAPHVLLPAHPNVQLIGIRDIDKRLRDDPDFSSASMSADADADTAYFTLFEQMSSLLRRDAFPNLRFVRDLSAKSHRMRTVRPAERVVRFWMNVVRSCQERGVWLEDHSGINVTVRNLCQARLNQVHAWPSWDDS
ncbi:hypothetical protein POSPLADRAFT_1074532 [Postia placenta MAD-698-R-SB12]|uniref:Uncharacterized protein n=1 Tax=Postia placenta MAD-698-R-SB12 TaxID=670580 RepID=A0A1X6N1N0_9APHY|nr:hypothetical protein POSPLADRAFT_1074532 [Postia placenta MAD-698-R-SB12]OSX62504.1 hypothetical protein POSPLADRAFT_1074532 [Postia placenta MAD-698-R-SB12]